MLESGGFRMLALVGPLAPAPLRQILEQVVGPGEAAEDAGLDRLAQACASAATRASDS